MNTLYDYWRKNKCEFYKQLNNLLKNYDKSITIFKEAALNDFHYWLENVNKDKNLTPYEALEKWFTEYAAVDYRDLFTDGYCPIDIDECYKENTVKKVCKELGITQKELAKKMGVSEGTIRNWSSQNNPPEWAIKFMKLLIEFEKVKEKADKAKQIALLLEELKK